MIFHSGDLGSEAGDLDAVIGIGDLFSDWFSSVIGLLVLKLGWVLKGSSTIQSNPSIWEIGLGTGWIVFQNCVLQ